MDARQVVNQSANRVPGFSYSLLSRYRSALMGIQIVLIVFFHFTETCMNADVRFDGFVRLFYTYIRSSGVDMFLLLSGLGLYYSWKRDSSYRRFMAKRFTRLLIPYFILAIPAWLVLYEMKGVASVRSFFEDLFFLSFFSDGEKWLWFILMASICYLLFPKIYDVVETARDKIEESMRVVTLCLVVTVVLILLKEYHGELYGNTNIAISRFPAFIVGVLLGKYSYEGRSCATHKVVLLFFFTAALLVPLDFADKPISGVYVRAAFNYSLCLIGLTLVEMVKKSSVIVVERATDIILKILSWLGRYTLEIYMTHVVIRTFLRLLGYPTYRISSELILIVTSMLLSVLLSKLADVLRPKALKVLGY